ncbi:MAG: D-glycero-beta-D-manno-heptose 1,7-bisphosphate 7-phosphatase [Steroidobacteraceae bacterium]
MSEPIRQAFILVGGKGTRLGETTRSVPKPLVDIDAGRTFLDFLIEQVARQGFNDIVLLAGHLGELVRDRYHGRRSGSSVVRVLVEQTAKGTGGALLGAREVLAPRFLVLNGDSFFDINFRSLAVDALKNDYEALIALHRVADASRYGSADLDGNRIIRFREKEPEAKGSALINAGVYVLTCTVLDRIHSLPCSIEKDVFPTLAREGKLWGNVRDGFFIDIGLPETLQRARRELPAIQHRPAAFLDRDGVLNIDRGYVHRPEQFSWIPGAHACIRRLNDLGYRVIIVTNQAGIAHGYYTEDSMHALHNWIQDRLMESGAFIDAFYYCPYHHEAKVDKYRRRDDSRKPGPGMILQACSEFGIDKDRSFLIGDKDSDIAAAHAAGIPGFLFSGGDLDKFLDECLKELAFLSHTQNDATRQP